MVEMPVCGFLLTLVLELRTKKKRITFFAKKIFSRQNSLFQNTKEKIGGKKINLQMNEVQKIII